MLMLEIMEKYGWDHKTYLDQPSWILDLAIKKLDIEAKLREKAQEKQKHAE